MVIRSSPQPAALADCPLPTGSHQVSASSAKGSSCRSRIQEARGRCSHLCAKCGGLGCLQGLLRGSERREDGLQWRHLCGSWRCHDIQPLQRRCNSGTCSELCVGTVSADAPRSSMPELMRKALPQEVYCDTQRVHCAAGRMR